ncbi:hypothetical protein [Verrucomicrobium sp. BvORR106]|uniref:hypothetical protein n=1 Tax=Verrucomicrobium sp. BvORR106 TaxID=1403819 RepID=UPI000571A164|nr:hypothetical protein [Verrucomicrobium sp. BvORR106]
MKFQYLAIPIDTSDSIDVEKDLSRLREHFDQGWELISVVGPATLKTALHSHAEEVMVYYLRRPVEAVGHGGI